MPENFPIGVGHETMPAEIITAFGWRAGYLAVGIIFLAGMFPAAFFLHMSPEDVERILLHPACVVGTDGLIGAPDGNPHPRAFGTMPHAIRMMTSGPHAVKIEKAVRKMTGIRSATGI